MKKIFLFLVLTTGLLACKSKQQLTKSNTSKPLVTTLSIIKEGALPCFNEVPIVPDQKVIYCEASAVVYYDNKLLFAADKDFLDSTLPIFQYDYPNLSKRTDATNNEFLAKGRKYEDFTLAGNGAYILLTTGFDRVKPNNSAFDNFNTLLAWRTDSKVQNAMPSSQVITIPANSQADNSVALRPLLAQALAEVEGPAPAYFKVEGLAALPDNHLLFGIREQGDSYQVGQFKYTCRFVSASYQITKDDGFTLSNDFRLAYEFNPDAQGLVGPLGVSSVEYDSKRQCLWFLTSHELAPDKGGIGAYLWKLNWADFKLGIPPTLVLDEKNQAFHFTHKAEDLTILPDGSLFVICDDDSALLGRKPNEAYYYIVNPQTK